MSREYLYFVMAPIEGLHLTCDFMVHSAALYGCPPGYTPTPNLLHEAYRQPYELLGRIPFNEYLKAQDFFGMDKLTQQALARVKSDSLKDHTCLAFEILLDRDDYASPKMSEFNSSLFERLRSQAEQIIDVLRLFFFKPGEDRSIGNVGALGAGVCGFWLSQNEGDVKFIARQTSRYQLVQDPIQIHLNDVRRIYNNNSYGELRYVACREFSLLSPFFQKIFSALRAFRESRELQSWEARIRHLAAIAEDLAKQTPNERLHGNNLRQRIASILTSGLRGANLVEFVDWELWSMLAEPEQSFNTVDELWSNVRNPIAHSLHTMMSLKRDPLQDMANMEIIVIAMIHALVFAWVLADLVDKEGPYEVLLQE